MQAPNFVLLAMLHLLRTRYVYQPARRTLRTLRRLPLQALAAAANRLLAPLPLRPLSLELMQLWNDVRRRVVLRLFRLAMFLLSYINEEGYLLFLVNRRQARAAALMAPLPPCLPLRCLPTHLWYAVAISCPPILLAVIRNQGPGAWHRGCQAPGP